ncbi:hypothetical protein BD779DRAFT_1578862 [Infundibulicybe gibba]|nr:hypothetical protein BD779DRAFT_1578862 [Infundibulicybe gibba]
MSRTMFATTPSTLATIRDLPVEILVIIFKLVYASSRRPKYPYFPTFGRTASNLETVWSTQEDILAPSLFPYAVASVCPGWRNILSTLPMCWTRLVIFADSDPTPLSDIREFLEWSRDLILDLTVINRRLDSPDASSSEYMRVRAVIDLVGPHFYRCRSITFQVRNSSSLPRLGNDFGDPCPVLDTLTLSCIRDDGKSLPRAPSPGFSCPSLKHLTVDGRNFKDIISLDKAWWTRRFSRVKRFTVSHFTPLIAGDTLSLYLALAVEFGSRPPSSLELNISSLQLENINNGALKDMFHVAEINTEFLHIVACNGLDTLPYSSYLTLDNIAPGVDLIAPLSVWGGHSLRINNCPDLTDSIFEMMATSAADGEFSVPVVKDIFITDCNNFSVDAIKRMVDVRNRAVEPYIDEPGFDQYETPLIRHVSVAGRGPVLSQEDAKWLCTRLENLDWRTLFGSGKLCHLRWHGYAAPECMCPTIENL